MATGVILPEKIPDCNFKCSSFLNNGCNASEARLHRQATQEGQYSCWCPKYNDKNQYLELCLGDKSLQIQSVATQGRPNFGENGGWFVQSYSVETSVNGDQWLPYKEFGVVKIFEANQDSDSIVTNAFRKPILAKYLRIKPSTWHQHIALRVEVFIAADVTCEGAKDSSVMSARKTPLGNPTACVQLDSKVDRVERNDIQCQSSADASDVMKGCLTGEDGGIHSLHAELKQSVSGDHELRDASAKKPASMPAPQMSFPSSVVGANLVDLEGTPVLGDAQVDSSSDSRVRLEQIKSMDRMSQHASAVVSTTTGGKYIGRIKLIKCEEPEDDPEPVEACEKVPVVDYDVLDVAKRIGQMRSGIDADEKEGSGKAASVDMETELQYRSQMDTKVAERLQAFKEAERVLHAKQMTAQEEQERKALEKRRKEEERVRKEEERRLLIQKQIYEAEQRRKMTEEDRRAQEDKKEVQSQCGSEADHIQRERQLLDETELVFRSLQNLGPDPKSQSRPKSVLKRWQIEGASPAPLQQDRDSSVDSGMVEEEEEVEEEVVHAVEVADLQTELEGIDIERRGYDPDWERAMLQRAEEAFRNYSERSKLTARVPNSGSEAKTSAHGLIRMFSQPNAENILPAEKVPEPASQALVEGSRQEGFDVEPTGRTSLDKDGSKRLDEERAGLLTRLELADKRVAAARGRHEALVGQKRPDLALEAEEEFHAACLEVSRIKKSILQVESEIKSGAIKRQTAVAKSATLSRERKAPTDKPAPDVDKASYNEEGECVPEGIIQNRLKAFQKKLAQS